MPTGDVLFSHATCSGGRGLELLKLESRRELSLIAPKGEIGESAPHPDGQRIVFSRITPDGTELVDLNLRELTERRIGLVSVEGPKMRLAWRSDEEILFQNRSVVWRLKADGTSERFHEITQRGGDEQ